MNSAARVGEQRSNRVKLVFRLDLAVAEPQRLYAGHPLNILANRLYRSGPTLVPSKVERFDARALADGQANLLRYLLEALVRELVI